MRKSLLSVVVLAAIGSGAANATVTEAMLENSKDTKSVLNWGMSRDGQRYSTLNKVNDKNVNKLVPAWSMSFGGEKQRGQESQPLIHNGKMFVTASYSRIFAVDSKTGAKLWKYEHRLPDGIMPCCDVINRGAALYDNLVIFGTLDAQIVALDQNTGKVVWKETVDDFKAGYSMSAAPLIVNGLVITGVSGGEFGIIGRVEARDAKTGKLVWIRPTVEGHMGYKYDAAGKAIENGVSGTTGATWPGEMWKSGGAATWLGGSYDSKTGLVYFGTGNPGPWNSAVRPGDNLFSCSTVAIDPKTGKIAWEIPNNAPLWGGVMTTAGNLVFWGTPEGFLKAADAKTGKELWKFQTGSGIVAPPITWEQDGEQYISVVSGWGGAVPLWGGDVAKKVSFLEQGGSVWTFKLAK